MASYFYLKKTPKKIKKSKSSIYWSLSFLGIGVFLLSLVFWPILSFEINSREKLMSEIVSPLPQNQVLGVKTDLSGSINWLPKNIPRVLSSKINSYSLSVSKLGIKDATVIIGSEDLSKSLIQWGGTGLPGEFGNTVIFGHSVLPAFYDPKNYMTIFSTLSTLKESDEIFVYFDGITYRYQVFEMLVVAPEDVSSMFQQKFDDSYLSLITCVPPGTYWKRLIVRARLVKI